ncbi:MAG: L-ribulose-5-phosphate 4-epimerase AraD [Candidatus Latescibacterota bacterium]
MLEQLKQEAWEANMALPRYGLVCLTWGNASALDRGAGILAIKPSGVSYDALQPQDMVLVDLDGRTVEGALSPSADTPTHVRLYQVFPRIGGVVHTHSKFATAFAQAGRSIPCLGTTHADHFRGPIPVTRPLRRAEIRGEYERETGSVIAECLAGVDPHECPGALVHGHGPFAWGPTAAQAAQTALVMELLAEMALYTRQLDAGLHPIDPELHDRHFLRKHGKGAYYGQRGRQG